VWCSDSEGTPARAYILEHAGTGEDNRAEPDDFQPELAPSDYNTSQRYLQVAPDPLLIEKVRDIAGYITLREHSPVLGVVETSQSCDGRARYNTLMMWFCK
jgi:hypothetical protein